MNDIVAAAAPQAFPGASLNSNQQNIQNSVMIQLPIYHSGVTLEYWIKFQQFEFANELLIILGAFLVLVGVIKIVRSSIKMLFWVLLSGLGAISVAYGMDQSDVRLPGTEGMELNELLGHGKELSMDVRQVLCNKWLSISSDE